MDKDEIIKAKKYYCKDRKLTMNSTVNKFNEVAMILKNKCKKNSSRKQNQQILVSGNRE